MIATTLHQVEVTSRCNLRCVYCLHPTMTRSKQDMPWPTWTHVLRWLAHFVDAGTQGELALSGTGEPTLHPDLGDMAATARAILGPGRRIVTTTNGLAITPALVEALAVSNVRVYVSLHRPEKAARAVHLLDDAGILEQVVMDPVVGANSWAGQVDWPDRVNPANPADRFVCPWLAEGWLFCASTGWLYSCCYANGDTPTIGHIEDDPRPVQTQTWAACAKCWLRPPAPGERAGRLTR